MRDGQGADSRGRGPPSTLPRAQGADRRAGRARQSHQRFAVLPGRIRLRAAAPQSTPTARRVENGRWPRATGSSEGADQPGTRSVRTADRTDQGGGSRAGRTVRCGEGGGANASTGDDVARHQRHRTRVRRRSLVGRVVPTLRQSTAGRFLRGAGADTLAERIGRTRTGRVQIGQSAIANNTYPARLVMAAPSAAIGAGSVV